MSDYVGESDRQRRWTYWVAWGLLVVFVLIGLFTFDTARDTRQASDKADELITALEDDGLTPPPKDQITRVLGDDGGALCDDPGGELRQSIVNAQLPRYGSGAGSVTVGAVSAAAKVAAPPTIAATSPASSAVRRTFAYLRRRSSRRMKGLRF